MTLMPMYRIDEDAIRSGYVDVITGYLNSVNATDVDMKSVADFVATMDIAGPVSKPSAKRKRSPEEIEEAERVKHEKKEARDVERLAKKEAKAAEKAAAKEAKAAEKAAAKAAKEAARGEWLTAKRLKNPDGGDDPKGKSGSFLRYQIHRTSGEVMKKNEANWTDEAKAMLEKIMSAKKAEKPDMMKAVKAVAKKQASPKKTVVKKSSEDKKAEKMALVKAAKAAKAAEAAEAAEAAKAEAQRLLMLLPSDANTETIEGENEVAMELEFEDFEEADTSIRKPFTWDKHPEMELYEDSDKWVWDSVEEDANPVCYYDEDEEEYVVAPGSEELLA